MVQTDCNIDNVLITSVNRVHNEYVLLTITIRVLLLSTQFVFSRTIDCCFCVSVHVDVTLQVTAIADYTYTVTLNCYHSLSIQYRTSRANQVLTTYNRFRSRSISLLCIVIDGISLISSAGHS